MIWYSPSWNGDHRLETVEDGKTCRLVVWDPTPHELELLGLFLADLKSGGHIDKTVALPEKELLIPAPIGLVAPLLVRHTQPKDRTITAVRYEGGQVEVIEGTGKALTQLAVKAEPPLVPPGPAKPDAKPVTIRWAKDDDPSVEEARKAFGDLTSRGYTAYKVDEKGEKRGEPVRTFRRDAVAYILVVEPEKQPEKPAEAKKDEDKGKAEAAVSTKRATPCCPQCLPGAIQPASEVLLTFLDEQQHRDWARHRTIEVEGGTTGHRYLISHRHAKNGQRWGRICWDADDRDVLHFHDSSVPPEEEVLGAMLVMEHREHWLRNEATCLGNFTDVLKNPFGDIGDGIESTSFTTSLGQALMTASKLLPAVSAAVDAARRMQ